VEFGEDTYTPRFYEEQKDGARRSARVILPVFFDLLETPPTSVLDVGCGTGAWLAVCRELGVQDVCGLDGAYVARELLQIPEDRFEPHDVTVPVRLGRRFDVVMSLEVAEHLPPARAESFVADLVAHSDVVLFSAAVPGQGGAGHQHCEWPDYWISLFAASGYRVLDCVRPRVWNEPQVEWWYAQNTLVFVSPAARIRSGTRADWGGVPVIHPRFYLEKTAPRPVSLGEVARSLPALGRQFASMTVGTMKRGARLLQRPKR
jgi:SAM-dependent methyltransferase